ncbi:hypothetical protein DEO72_LG9g1450 [Vigna unguiculata]|uniref:Uncharacterized protein n=1 Tax=Vigna unguiculata TaxID=3917 RepID=A0A4D6MZI8_VIGUN|nr:hypothetical protein DEO72_LG9g1450 [Vigna unguiculata]
MNCRQATHPILLVFWVPERNRLASEIDGNQSCCEGGGSGSRWRLAVRRGALGGVCSLANTKARSAWRHRKFRQVIVAAVVKTKALSARRYVSPAKRSESDSAWRYVSPARRFYYSNIGVLDFVGVIYKAYGDASKGLKHVVFLELRLGITSLELWLGMADEHEELLSCGSGWRVLSV